MIRKMFFTCTLLLYTGVASLEHVHDLKKPEDSFVIAIEQEKNRNNKNENLDFSNPFIEFLESKKQKIIQDNKLAINPQKILDQTILEAIKIYDAETEIRTKYRDVLIPENIVKFEKNKQVNKLNLFLNEIQYYGRALANINHKDYSKKYHTLFDKHKIKRTDCITYLLDCLTSGSGINYVKKEYSDSEGLGNYLINNGFETIFVAQNTISKEKKYSYNNGAKNNYVKDVIPRIKKQKYYLNVNYIVSDSNFMKKSFQTFLNSASGFVFIQDGKHVGILTNGTLYDAIESTNPLKGRVFHKEKLYSRMDNDNPEKDYQSALILVPKGTVKKFLEKNTENYGSNP